MKYTNTLSGDKLEKGQKYRIVFIKDQVDDKVHRVKRALLIEQIYSKDVLGNKKWLDFQRWLQIFPWEKIESTDSSPIGDYKVIQYKDNWFLDSKSFELFFPNACSFHDLLSHVCKDLKINLKNWGLTKELNTVLKNHTSEK